MTAALADHLMAGRVRDEMGKSFHRHRVAVANMRRHGIAEGHEFETSDGVPGCAGGGLFRRRHRG